MQKQVIAIHGGTTFDDYGSYLDYLENKKVTAKHFRTPSHWQDSLEKELGKEFEVFTPRLPNKDSAHYQEWRIWFEKMVPFINDEVILVGYSLGGIFLVKYLSENIYPKKIGAVILVAAPFDTEGADQSLGDFILPVLLDSFANQVQKIHLIFSKDDPVALFAQLEKYQKALPGANTLVFEDRGHFNQELFPEIIGLIKTL